MLLGMLNSFCFCHAHAFPMSHMLINCVCFCSVSSLLTTTEAVVVELPKDEKETPAGMGGGMGGMGGMDYW